MTTGQKLEILAPQAPPNPAAQWGGMGFRVTLGAGGGAQPNTGAPVRVAADYNPAPP